MRSYIEARHMADSRFQFTVQCVIDGSLGRPSFKIPVEQLQYLIENGFSVPELAEIIGVSIRTVRRRMSDFGLSIRAQYSLITDTELDALVSEIQLQFPMCGNRQMQGHLLSRGFRVQQSRVREVQPKWFQC